MSRSCHFLLNLRPSTSRPYSTFVTNAPPSTCSDRTLVLTPSLSAVEDRQFFPRQDALLCPLDWTMFVHPKGTVYFRNATRGVVTDHDLTNPSEYRVIQSHLDNDHLPCADEDVEILLHVSPEGLHVTPEFVNHSNCTASGQLTDVLHDNVTNMGPHRVNDLRRNYWCYLENHPSHTPTPQRAVPDAQDALTWCMGDNLKHRARSLALFSNVECGELLSVMDRLVGMLDTFGQPSPAKTAFLAWILRQICDSRKCTDYGLPLFQRAIAKQTPFLKEKGGDKLRYPTWKLALIRVVMTVLCFGIPYSHYRQVKNMCKQKGRFADQDAQWETYTARIAREYADFLLIATVLLAATISFLALPNMDQGTKICITLSALASLASMIIAVFCVWRHRSNTRSEDPLVYIQNIHNNFLALHGHAMLLSLPLVLLVWAVITFTAAIMVYTLYPMTLQGYDAVAFWMVTSFFVVLTGLVVLALYTFSIHWDFKPRLKHVLARCDWYTNLRSSISSMFHGSTRSNTSSRENCASTA